MTHGIGAWIRKEVEHRGTEVCPECGNVTLAIWVEEDILGERRVVVKWCWTCGYREESE